MVKPMSDLSEDQTQVPYKKLTKVFSFTLRAQIRAKTPALYKHFDEVWNIAFGTC